MAKKFVCGRCGEVVKGTAPYMTRDNFPICEECLEKYRIKTLKSLDEILVMRPVPKVVGARKEEAKPAPMVGKTAKMEKPVVSVDPFAEEFKPYSSLDFANAFFDEEEEVVSAPIVETKEVIKPVVVKKVAPAKQVEPIIVTQQPIERPVLAETKVVEKVVYKEVPVQKDSEPVDYVKLAEDLERFGRLAEAGILSAEEFAAIKAKILAKML